IDRPVRYGSAFQRPTRKAMRLHRARQGPKLFTADEVRRMIDAAGWRLKAILLLGINCGFGNADCGHLPLTAIDLDRGVIDFPRRKTGMPRRCPLWPETVAALREALARRSRPADPADGGFAFLTQKGLRWTKNISANPLSKRVRKLLLTLGINGRKGLG